ncbi:hypothetical protein RFI_13368 [Reticulomyxa filosa]|uniref:Uncharacterized protein n=1 Tax=Reticulomyxa filosa TaxID=46433 RepID=X6NBY4_RETFI|nr:hypothetical protein RFI_13368 [Reticulomyxa filosa]|eukprot:ETO23805.1 hypothetical protein RFI_13368 [Reticulomyxa filosa]
MEIFQQGFNILQNMASVHDEGIDLVEKAFCNALNLLQVVMEHEESFLEFTQRHRPGYFNFNRLETRLLSVQYRPQMISLAACVNYVHPYIRIQSLRILKHLNKFKQDDTCSLSGCFVGQQALETIQHAFSSQLCLRPAPRDVDEDATDNRIDIVQFLIDSTSAKQGHALAFALLGFSNTSSSNDNFHCATSCLGQVFVLCRLTKLTTNIFVVFFFFFFDISKKCILLDEGIAEELVDSDADAIICLLNQRLWLLKSIALYCAFYKHFPSLFASKQIDASSLEQIVHNSSPLDTHNLVFLGLIKDLQRRLPGARNTTKPVVQNALKVLFEEFAVNDVAVASDSKDSTTFDQDAFENNNQVSYLFFCVNIERNTFIFMCLMHDNSERQRNKR